MRYKTSKFNILVDNKKGYILLYNACQGTKSFLKVRQNSNLLHYLEKEIIIPSNDECADILINKGFIVPYELDETENLRELFERKINSKQLNLIISPTTNCNLRCQYCCEEFYPEKMSEELQASIILFLEKNIDKYYGINIDWFGGEPLLALDVIENIASHAIKICEKNNKPYSSFITTNGTLLTPSTFELLYKLKVMMYQVTLDGVACVHDKQRKYENGMPTFETIYQNLLAIKKSDLGKRAIISILTNYSKELEPYIEEYKCMMNENFSDDCRFAFACNVVMDLGGDRIKQYRDSLVGSEGMENFYDRLIDIDGVRIRYIFDEFLRPGGMICYAAKKNSFVVSPNGMLYKCEHLFQQNDLNGVIGEFQLNGEIIYYKEKLSSWIGKFNYCKNDSCKLFPLCLGEDCIKNRISQDNKGYVGKMCENNLCHFQKETVSNVLRLLDHERSMFPLYDF